VEPCKVVLLGKEVLHNLLVVLHNGTKECAVQTGPGCDGTGVGGGGGGGTFGELDHNVRVGPRIVVREDVVRLDNTEVLALGVRVANLVQGLGMDVLECLLDSLDLCLL